MSDLGVAWKSAKGCGISSGIEGGDRFWPLDSGNRCQVKTTEKLAGNQASQS